MGRIAARRQIKTFIRNVVLVIVGCLWVLFLVFILNDLDHLDHFSTHDAVVEEGITYFLITLIGIAPLGFALTRLVR
jgi:hypothetical protein